jgi:hypothetical protein
MKMRFILPIIALALCSFKNEEGVYQIPLTYTLDRSEADSTLTTDEAIFKFTFKGISDLDSTRSIDFSIDGIAGKKLMTDNSFIEISTTPGAHKFQFFYNENYFEVYIDSLNILPQYRNDYSVYFQDANEMIMSDKPVIYLYPKEEIDVEVKLAIKGHSPFLYPAYDDGWKCRARPDGTLSFNEATYNYLFWEAASNYQIPSSDLQTGFIVSKAETVTFLEEKLTTAGLTSKEQADFITYWAPRMIKNESNFVRFEFNEACNAFAEIDISPEPDNIYRIYILWSPIEENFEVKEQKIVPMNRKGFIVLEWGGQEHSINSLSHNF